MGFPELAAGRYSVRSYKADPVEPEKLSQVLEAARLAPTANNRQPFRLIVVHTQGREKELSRIYPEPWFTQAPIIICACGIPGQAWVRRDGKNYCDVDVAIAMDHLILTAASLVLGTCWTGAFDPTAAREVLGLPDGVQLIVCTPLGYPNEKPGVKLRKPLEKIINYERWQG